MKKILIITDAWEPQVNGVVTTMTTVVKKLEEKLQTMTDELSKEKDPDKQQNILKSINLLIDTISKLKE